MKVTRRAMAIFLLLSGAASGAELNDWIIVPGKRVGPISAKTTRADLVRLFGAKNVEDGDVTVGDEVGPGTLVMKDQPDAALGILWNDDTPEPHIASIHFCPENGSAVACRWHTEDAIGFGTTLKTLEKMNGGKFKLLGFAWDFEGTVISWNGGRLQRLSDGCLGIGLAPRPDQPIPEGKRDFYDQVTGDKEFWSSDTAMQTLDPCVIRMSASFQNCGHH